MNDKLVFSGSTLTTLPVGDFILHINNSDYVYDPKDDITSVELARMMQLFAYMVSNTSGYHQYDFLSFIEKHNLQRHFILK
jgi:hypothetical protein